MWGNLQDKVSFQAHKSIYCLRQALIIACNKNSSRNYNQNLDIFPERLKKFREWWNI